MNPSFPFGQAKVVGIAEALPFCYLEPGNKESDEASISMELAPDGRVRLIILNPGLIERLYASRGLSAAQLAQRFAAEHGLPAMEHGVNANPPRPEHYWQHVSRRGWKIVIDEGRDIVLSYWRGEPGEKF